MTAPRLNDDDVLAAVSPTTAPAGLHEMSGRTRLFLVDDQGEPQTEMVSRHEMAHATLNRTTIFGGLLQQVAIESDLTPGSRRLVDLVDACRFTHECFATSFGLWLTRGDADALLAPYPTYVEYLATGRRIVSPLPDHSLGALAVIESVARAAMQAPIHDLVGDEDLAGVSLADLPPSHQPDHRFRVLIESGRDFTVPLAGEELWQVPVTSLPSERLDGEHVTRRHTELTEAVFSICSEVLADIGGYPTAGFDAHMDRVPDREEKLARRFIQEPDRPLLLKHGAHERVHLRDYTPELFVITVEEYLADPLELPASVVVTRPTSRLFEQYSLDSESRQLLAAADRHGFTTGLRIGIGPDRGRSVLLAVMKEPPSIEAFQEAIARREEEAISSISLSAIASVWRDEWWPAMPNPTLLLDTHPFGATEIFKKFFNTDPDPMSDPLCSAWRVMRNADHTHVTGAYLRLTDRPDDEAGLIGVAVTTTTVALELLELWRSPSTLGALDDEPPLQLRLPAFAELLGNLAEEEPWFDFSAPLPTPPPD